MKTNKRTKTLGLHEWSKNDTIISLYVTKFGTRGLYLKSEKDIANFIGTSEGSLKMQCANIRSLMGQTDKTLSDFTKIQSQVYDEYNGMSQFQLMNEIKKIINQDDYERRECLKQMGKNPDKMTIVK